MRLIRNFVRHIRDGFISVFRHAAMSLSSASAVTLALMLIAIFLVLSMNLDAMMNNVESTVSIAAYVDWDHEENADLKKIESAISNIPGVATVTFSSKDNELDIVMNSMASEQAKGVMNDYRGENNPLHNVFIVEVENGDEIANITNMIVAIDGIESADYGGDSTLMLMDMMNKIRIGVVALVGVLGILAIFLISNTIKITIQARKKEIAIMRQVGATNAYIRAPFVVEGTIIGALGSLVPIAATVFGYIYLYNLTGGYFLTRMFELVPPHPFVLYIAACILGAGIFVGLVGSYISVTRYLRWKR